MFAPMCAANLRKRSFCSVLAGLLGSLHNCGLIQLNIISLGVTQPRGHPVIFNKHLSFIISPDMKLKMEQWHYESQKETRGALEDMKLDSEPSLHKPVLQIYLLRPCRSLIWFK